MNKAKEVTWVYSLASPKWTRPMRIADVKPKSDYTLQVTTDNGRTGIFDMRPYLEFEAFAELKKKDAFVKIMNGKYFVEWDCGADLSADTIEAHLKLV